MIVALVVEKAGKPIFRHDLAWNDTASFSQQAGAAIAKFREEFPNISLLDDDVSHRFMKKEKADAQGA